jgi:hypothetical protein
LPHVLRVQAGVEEVQLRDMFDGRAKLETLDNDRYPGMRWTPAREVLAACCGGRPSAGSRP